MFFLLPRAVPAAVLLRAANLVQKDISETKCLLVNGSFPDECQLNSVPQSLLALIRLVLYGRSTGEFPLAQLIVFNSYTCMHVGRREATKSRHTKHGETPLPLFVGVLVHSRTKSKDLVYTLFRLGLFVSYDRVLAVSGDLGNSALSQHFENLGTVCPSKLNTGVFTTSAVDNIDHSPTAKSAHGSSHGTGISLFQHSDLAKWEKRTNTHNSHQIWQKRQTTARQPHYCAIPLFRKSMV